ncbi:DUF4434 domain-containing protein [Isoptericola sp. NPDC019482]|uniref:DUF4434 domain-containing protein n=1 Tax=Isoptericola sp. NPDC019482 TaxID=3154688 RepID=UPI003473D0FB
MELRRTTADGRPAAGALAVLATLAVVLTVAVALLRPDGGAPAPAGATSSHLASPAASAVPTSGPTPSPTPSAAPSCSWGGRLDRPDRTVRTEYAVTGWFVLTTPDRCATRATVQGAHAIGADTLLTFGAELAPASPADLRPGGDDERFAGFTVDGGDGYDHAVARTGGGTVRHVYTYAAKATFDDAALFCPGHDGRSTTAHGTYTWWLLPVEGGYSDCDSPSRTYDLVVAHAASQADADALLVADAERFGMTVFLGLPKPAPDPATPYVADDSYTQTLGGFTSRVLAGWDARYGSRDAFAGVYQSLETAVFTDEASWAPNLRVYELQHRIVGFRLPRDKQRVVVSPYADLRRDGGTPVAAVRPALQRIADTAGGVRMVLAPQDGGGTGRVGVFGPGDRDRTVRADLHAVVGDTTYGEAYAGSTATLYAEAAKVRGATLWANVEAFRPPGEVGDRAPSDLATLDRQVALARPHVEKLIGYRWDDYLDASGLAADIAARG